MLSEEPRIPDNVAMTAMEKRLARRVHNQRRRLRQWETVQSWHTLSTSLRRIYCESMLKANKRCRDAEAALKQFKAGRPFWHRVLDLFGVKP